MGKNFSLRASEAQSGGGRPKKGIYLKFRPFFAILARILNVKIFWRHEIVGLQWDLNILTYFDQVLALIVVKFLQKGSFWGHFGWKRPDLALLMIITGWFWVDMHIHGYHLVNINNMLWYRWIITMVCTLGLQISPKWSILTIISPDFGHFKPFYCRLPLIRHLPQHEKVGKTSETCSAWNSNTS